jgi:hypothetical protein
MTGEIPEYLGTRKCKRKKNDGEIQMWERGERKQGEILNDDGREIGWMKNINGTGGTEWKTKEW